MEKWKELSNTNVFSVLFLLLGSGAQACLSFCLNPRAYLKFLLCKAITYLVSKSRCIKRLFALLSWEWGQSLNFASIFGHARKSHTSLYISQSECNNFVTPSEVTSSVVCSICYCWWSRFASSTISSVRTKKNWMGFTSPVFRFSCCFFFCFL